MYQKLGVCILAAGLLSGCASIVGQAGPETIHLSSAPDRADITIVDEAGAVIYRGYTPTMVNLEKKKGYFSGKDYIVTISKAGYKSRVVPVKTRANAWYVAGNIVFGGIIGYLIVDPLTGAMWTFNTKLVNVDLQEAGMSGRNEMGLNVVMLQDLPASLRDGLVVLSPGH